MEAREPTGGGGGVSPVFVASCRILVALLLFVSFAPAEGEPQVIGSVEPIVVCAGVDVVLPCHTEPPVNVAGLTVEWSKPDLQPDPNDRLSRVEYVHLYRDTREVPDMKLASYVRRTALFADGLRHGNISLRINNVTLADEGRYKCFIPKLRSPTQFSIIRLVVVPNSPTTETPLQPDSLQTPDPKEETKVNGILFSRSRLMPLVVVCAWMILTGGLVLYLAFKSRSQKPESSLGVIKTDV